jgi:hypothetical protein
MASTAATDVPAVSAVSDVPEMKQWYVLTEEKEKQPIETIWQEMFDVPLPHNLTIDDLYNITKFLLYAQVRRLVFTGKKILVGMYYAPDLETERTLVEALVKLPRKKSDSTPEHNEFEYYHLEELDIDDMNDGNLTDAEVEILKSEAQPFLKYYKLKTED